MAPTSFDPIHSAVLSMDLQAGLVSIYAPNNEGLIARAGAVLQHGRRAGLRIIHIKVGFRTGLPEIHPRNSLLGELKASPKHQQLFEGVSGSIHAGVAPEDGDIVVTKSRVNAFVGTDLDVVLRAGETMRYGFEIVSDHFVSPKPQVFEVAWNGQWSNNLDEMAKNLQIREIKD